MSPCHYSDKPGPLTQLKRATEAAFGHTFDDLALHQSKDASHAIQKFKRLLRNWLRLSYGRHFSQRPDPRCT